jgi:hypothetical protein
VVWQGSPEIIRGPYANLERDEHTR